jgi:hypothetical protein
VFFPLFTLAQNGLITGKVTNSDGKTPIYLANVFLSNTTAGSSTNNDGEFALRDLKPGEYNLIVSIVGYETYSTNVLVGDQPIRLNIKLNYKNNELREVTITTPANWKKYYDQFIRDFIGTDDNAKYCYVQNPQSLNFNYHKSKQELEAYTEDFLVVDNLSLGYRVKFLVNEFTSSKLTGIISSSGKRLFSELPGTRKQKEEWKKKRDMAYYGSAMHFYRSLYTNKLDQEGFQIMKLTRKLNPNRPPEEFIQDKIKKFNDGHHRDSVMYWIGMEDKSKYYKENLERTPLSLDGLLFRTQQPGVFAVDFSDCLYIRYVYKREETVFRDVFQPIDLPNYETTIATITKPFFFDTNGVVFGDSAPLYEGTWSKSKLSDLLPVDYTPTGPAPTPQVN